MHLSDFPVEVVENICSYLGGDAYVAKMVPYLRPYVKDCSKEDYMVSVYERQDFVLIYLYDHEKMAREEIEKKKETYSNYLLLEEMEKLLD
ncbi:Hypothetical protein ZAZAV_521 [Cedratvirus Zaza IHUMI]|uniref:Ankyrin repeat-containing protein n=1 Tax=Cedratvirus Zaza IHUMI TaxID=2126979 RepID=A0A2R8FFS0_9VIRU|nr:Hypothetical protein ZAZAV_521 [Cedratvirus Zaza IHUMI]